MRVGDVLTTFALKHNVTREDTRGNVITSAGADVCFVEVVFPNGSELGNVELEEGLTNREFGKKAGGLFDNLINVLEFALMQGLDVLNKLLNPRITGFFFVPIGTSEPGS